jgi:hypothetical protein
MDFNSINKSGVKMETHMNNAVWVMGFIGCMSVIAIFIYFYEKCKQRQQRQRLQEMQANPPFQPPLLMHPAFLNPAFLNEHEHHLPTYDESVQNDQSPASPIIPLDIDQSAARIISPLKRSPRQNHLPTYEEAKLVNLLHQVYSRLLQEQEQDDAYFSSQDTPQQSAAPAGTPESDTPPPPYVDYEDIDDDDNDLQQSAAPAGTPESDTPPPPYQDDDNDDHSFPYFSRQTLQQDLQGDHLEVAPPPQLPWLQMMQYAPNEDEPL